MDTTYKNITDKAIRAVSNPHAVSRIFGFRSPESVYKWIKNDRIPSKHVLELCRLGNWAVTPYELRPDVYPAHDLHSQNTSSTQKESD